jgi:hypothetical protein
MRLRRLVPYTCAILATLFFAAPASAQLPLPQPATFPSGPNPAAVPTYNSIGLYWTGAGGPGAQVEYKETTSLVWKRGHDLWFDARNNEHRGSLVELKAGTTYDIKLNGGTPFQATTWSESLPVPPLYTMTLAPGIKVVSIFGSNVPTPTSTISPDGLTQTIRVPAASDPAKYTLFTGTPGQNTIDQGDFTGSPPACISISLEVRYLIIRGLVLANCKRNGISLNRFSEPLPGATIHNIVIEDNEIYGYGAGATESTATAIYCGYRDETVDSKRPHRVTVQRNIIRDPRFGAPTWATGGAPPGPHGIYFNNCGNNHVIRYNELYSTGGNHFADAMGGSNNSTADSAGFAASRGFPWADSDIHGNRISFARDDGIEAEGANRNVRIWGNYLDRVTVAMGNADTAIGPLYVWRNVSNHMAGLKGTHPNPDDEDRGPFAKTGAAVGALNGGASYYYHNTILQPPPAAGSSLPSGAGEGLSRGSSRQHYNLASRNNIWQIHHPTENDFASIRANCVMGGCDVGRDVYDGAIDGATEVNGFLGVPIYNSASFMLPSDANGWAGNFTLDPASPGYAMTAADAYIHGFSQVANPDVGAHQSGTAPMLFGRRACYPAGGLNQYSCRP